MKYLCLAYYDAEKLEGLPRAELEGIVRQCPPHDEALRKSGHLVLQASLGGGRSAARIRPRGGQPVVFDGPFVETKELVGGFFVVEARDLNEAIRVASKHPAAHLGEQVGWGIEVRPIEAFERPPAPGRGGDES